MSQYYPSDYPPSPWPNVDDVPVGSDDPPTLSTVPTPTDLFPYRLPAIIVSLLLGVGGLIGYLTYVARRRAGAGHISAYVLALITFVVATAITLALIL